MPDIASHSPDGRYVVETTTVSMRMSHEVHAPIVRDLEDDVVIMSLRETLWSLDKTRWHDGAVTLTLRKYPDGASRVTATLDLEGGTATVRGDTVPVGDLKRALDVSSVDPRDEPLAALLYDTLDALEGGPDASGIEGEIYAILRGLEGGTERVKDARALFLPTGELQDLSIAQGWGDRFLEIAAAVDKLGTPRRPVPASRTVDTVRTRRSWRPPRILVIFATSIAAVIVAAFVGGPWAALGVGALALALLLPVLVALVRFLRDPVGSLLRGPRTVRSRLRRSWRTRAFVVLEVALVVMGIAALVQSC